MNKVPETFKRAGWLFELFARDGEVAVYRKSRGKVESLEVVIIRERKERECFGKVLEAAEHYPSSEEWGVLGWTYTDLAAAKTKMGVLVGGKSANLNG